MPLKPIAQEMLDLTRFGCDIIRLTRPKKKKKGKVTKEDENGDDEVFDDPYKSHLTSTSHRQEEIPKDQEPYGPIQVRFCQGARSPIDYASAKQIANAIEAKVREVIAPYRAELVDRVKTMVTEQSLKNAEKIVQLCDWIDCLDEEFLQVNIVDPQPATNLAPGIPSTPGRSGSATMALSSAWVCYVDETEAKRAEDIATKLKGVFASIRNTRLVTLAQNLAKALDQKPVQQG